MNLKDMKIKSILLVVLSISVRLSSAADVDNANFPNWVYLECVVSIIYRTKHKKFLSKENLYLERPQIPVF